MRGDKGEVAPVPVCIIAGNRDMRQLVGGPRLNTRKRSLFHPTRDANGRQTKHLNHIKTGGLDRGPARHGAPGQWGGRCPWCFSGFTRMRAKREQRSDVCTVLFILIGWAQSLFKRCFALLSPP
jgi:hypothetical protein